MNKYLLVLYCGDQHPDLWEVNAAIFDNLEAATKISDSINKAIDDVYQGCIDAEKQLKLKKVFEDMHINVCIKEELIEEYNTITSTQIFSIPFIEKI